MNLAKLARKVLLQPDKVPPGWETSEQIAKKNGYSESRARALLIAGIRAGLIERKKFRLSARGNVFPISHYREKKCPAPRASSKKS